MAELTAMTCRQIRDAVARREVSAVEVCRAFLARIDRIDPALHAFITIDPDLALLRAADVDLRRAAAPAPPLAGVPVAVKDTLCTGGLTTTAGSRMLERFVPPFDATAVARLSAAGAIVLGKTNCDEFSMGSSTEHSAFGPTANPWAADRTPGGSSGGSAAAVVAGMGPASIGTDTGGSIRIPAAACGCVGLKPTHGELPIDGIVALSWTLDHVGPIARSVADAWLLYHAMAGTPDPAPLPPQAASPRGLRLGLLQPYFLDVLDDGVRAVFERACGQIARAGIAIDARAVAHAADTPAVYLHVQLAEASAYHAPTIESRPDLYAPAVRQRLEMGRYVLAEDYGRARLGARVLRREVDAALDGVAALLLPTLPIVAPALGGASVDIGGALHPVRGLMLRLTQLFDVTGHPAISIPCGRSTENLPVGLQLVGRRGETEALLTIAGAVEAALR
jgi:aspartyl-tRNA(Asn)/glutamyl-tRNA(Gln) amidotransferase subunit A